MVRSRPGLMVRSRSRLIGSIVGLTLVSDIGNISRVFIANLVGDNLSATIGKIYTVLAIGSISITVLMLFKVGTRVVIEDSIAIFIMSWGIISGFMVRISMVSGCVGGSWVVNGSRLVGRFWVVDGSRLVSRSRGMVDGSRLVGRSRGMVGGSRLVGKSRGMVDGSRFVGRSRGMVVIMGTGMVVILGIGMVVIMGTGMVVILRMGIVVSMRTGMVSMSRGMDRDVAGGMVGRNIFLLILVLVNLIGCGRGLAGHDSMGVSTGFVDGGSHSRSIAMFNGLVAMLIGNSQSQEG
jgi:hypothetical protein